MLFALYKLHDNVSNIYKLLKLYTLESHEFGIIYKVEINCEEWPRSSLDLNLIESLEYVFDKASF